MEPQEKGELLNLTTRIVSAYLTRNPVAVTDLPGLIAGACHSLATAEQPPAPKLEPAVPVKKSVTRAHITCLEDGTKHKMIKRHLRVAHQLTPEAYREKWGLADDYPMTAPNYAALRSRLAKQIAFGAGSQAKKRKPKG